MSHKSRRISTIVLGCMALGGALGGIACMRVGPDFDVLPEPPRHRVLNAIAVVPIEVPSSDADTTLDGRTGKVHAISEACLLAKRSNRHNPCADSSARSERGFFRSRTIGAADTALADPDSLAAAKGAPFASGVIVDSLAMNGDWGSVHRALTPGLAFNVRESIWPVEFVVVGRGKNTIRLLTPWIPGKRLPVREIVCAKGSTRQNGDVRYAATVTRDTLLVGTMRVRVELQSDGEWSDCRAGDMAHDRAIAASYDVWSAILRAQMQSVVAPFRP